MPPQDLGRKSLLLLASNWGGSALGMLVSLLVARILGAGAMGSIAVSLGLAGLCLAILLPGFGQAHLKRLAEGQDAGRCLGTMGLIQAGGVGALMVGLVSARALGVLEAAPDLTPVFVLVLGAQVASNVADIFLKVFIAREWIVEHALVVLVARLARLGATVAVLAIAPSVTLVAATFSIEGVLAAALGAGVLARRHDIRPRAANRASVREYWIYARPFMVTTPLALIQDSVDRVLVGRWAGLVAAGHYHVARALWEALSSIIAAFNTLLFTRLAALFAARSPARDAEARQFFAHALDKLLFVVTPLAFVLWAAAAPLLTALYGAEFAAAAPALRVLVLAALAATVVNPYTLVLYALDRGDRFVPVNLVRAAAYLLALAWLVPGASLGAGTVDGATGAAVARLFLVLFPAWVYVRWTRDLVDIPLTARAWIYLAGFALMVILAYGLERLGVPWAAAALAALVAYGAALGLAVSGTRDNLAYMAALLSPGALLTFVRGGLRRT